MTATPTDVSMIALVTGACGGAPMARARRRRKHQPDVVARLGSTQPGRGKWQVYPFGYRSR